MRFNGMILICIVVYSSCSEHETYRIREGTYSVKSNCDDATLQEGTLALSYRSDFSSRGIELNDAKTFGLPENLISGVSLEMDMQDENRRCRAPLFSRDTQRTVFDCVSKNDSVSDCKVSLTKL